MRRRNATQFSDLYVRYRTAYEHTVAELFCLYPDGVPINVPDRGSAAHRIIRDSAYLTWMTSRALVHLVAQDKAVPAAKSKAFERAFRAVDLKTKPRNATQWFVKNQTALQLLLETNSWSDKGKHVERAHKVCSFTVHNQTASEDVGATAKILCEAEDLLRRSGIPNISDVLYGDVFFVGQIERKKGVAAKYYPTRDVIFLIVTKRFEHRYLHSLIHEIGHRYWRKVMTRDQHQAWGTYHRSLAHRAVDVELPPLGSPLGEAKRVGDLPPPRIIGYPYIQGRAAMQLDTGGYVWVDQYIKYKKQEARVKLFPTAYASTDPEEHFCDAFSLFTMGELKEPHATNFVAVVRVQRAANPKWKRLLR
jgi:hypothetical protein